MAVELASDVALEASADFRGRATFACAALDVLASGGIPGRAHSGDDVQNHVELPVAPAVEAVADGLARRCGQRCHAGQHCEGCLGSDPAAVGPGCQDRRGGNRADGVNLQQAGHELVNVAFERGVVLLEFTGRCEHRGSQPSGLIADGSGGRSVGRPVRQLAMVRTCASVNALRASTPRS